MGATDMSTTTGVKAIAASAADAAIWRIAVNGLWWLMLVRAFIAVSFFGSFTTVDVLTMGFSVDSLVAVGRMTHLWWAPSTATSRG
jgi:hypothetical protein